MRIVFATILLAACTSRADDICNRADSCNYLDTTVETCVEVVDTALDDLPDSSREITGSQLHSCAYRSSCLGFAACIHELRTVDYNAAQPRSIDQLEIELWQRIWRDPFGAPAWFPAGGGDAGGS